MDDFQNTKWFAALCETSTVKSYRRGEIIRPFGDPSDFIGLIIEGRASAISYSIDGQQTHLNDYEPGQFTGLTSLLTEDTVCAEVSALSQLSLRLISRTAMLDLLRRDTALTERVIHELSDRLNITLTELRDVHTLSVKGRICAELIRLSAPIGINPDQHIIRPNPVLVDIARRLNSSRETVSRTVSDLISRDILSREPGALIVQNPMRLEEAVTAF
jgi:CRP-like cAMP-binding protein